MTDRDVADELDYDAELWIEVPVAFPFGPWADAATWAHDVAEEAALRPDARAAIAERALGLAASDWPATRRFWYFPVEGGYEAIVHVIDVDDVIPDAQITELLRSDDARVTDAVIHPIEGVPYAWRCAFVVAEGEGDARQAMGVLRAVRVHERGTSLVELVDVDLAVIGAVMPDFDRLVGALRFRERAVDGRG